MNYKQAMADLEKQLKDFVKNKKAVVGISGGIDSAVTAALCVRALGKENVVGVLMPYKNQDMQDAELLANHLGIENFNVNIKNAVDQFDFLELEKISKGNIMARIRMTILYAFANKFNGLVMGTGNKSELEIGYFTKYGDGGVDVELLGDLYKTDVVEIAKLFGIPEQIINKKPSAGLWEGQTDEDELGLTYAQLDAVLKKEINQGGVFEKVQRLRRNSEHKRNVPPIFKLGGDENV